MKIIILAILILIAILMCAIVSTPKSDYERKIEDEAQIEFLKYYRENKKK